MTKKGIMKTFLIIVCVWAWGLFFWFSSVANANSSDYNEAVAGHVITQTTVSYTHLTLPTSG